MRSPNPKRSQSESPQPQSKVSEISSHTHRDVGPHGDDHAVLYVHVGLLHPVRVHHRPAPDQDPPPVPSAAAADAAATASSTDGRAELQSPKPKITSDQPNQPNTLAIERQRNPSAPHLVRRRVSHRDGDGAEQEQQDVAVEAAGHRHGSSSARHFLGSSETQKSGEKRRSREKKKPLNQLSRSFDSLIQSAARATYAGRTNTSIKRIIKQKRKKKKQRKSWVSWNLAQALVTKSIR